MLWSNLKKNHVIFSPVPINANKVNTAIDPLLQYANEFFEFCYNPRTEYVQHEIEHKACTTQYRIILCEKPNAHWTSEV